MNFTINKKLYEIDESITVYEFMNKNNIFLPLLKNDYINISDNLYLIEKVGVDELINPKDVYISEGDNFYTNSNKVYNYLKNTITINCENLKNKLYQNIELDSAFYNILMCEADCYEECVSLYKNSGFDDIVNDKFAQMIFLIELTHQLILKTSRKIDNKTKTPLIIMQQSIIRYPKKYRVNLKPIDEVGAELIKNHYQKILNIQKPIRIIYVSKSVSCALSHLYKTTEYTPLIDDVVIMDNFKINNEVENKYNGKITNAIYLKDNEHLYHSSNYNSIFKIFKQMGLIEESLDIYTNEYGKALIVNYKDLTLKFLFTDHYLTIDDVNNMIYDFVFITTKKEMFIPNVENGFLTDYNINQIYKKIIVHPGKKEFFKRF